MSYIEAIHPHQSETLGFLSPDYVPYKVGSEGEKTWGVISFEKGEWKVQYQKTLPKFGGYITRDLVYGNPTYCPNATRNHHKHQKLYGSMPHLVFFDSVKSAKKAGFRPCGYCFKNQE